MTPRRVLILAVAALLLHFVLIAPNHPRAVTLQAPLLFALELPVILLALIVLRGWALRLLQGALVAWLGTVSVVKLADMGTFMAYARPFDFAVDLHLLHAAWTLARGSFGTAPTLLIVLGTLAGFVALVLALVWAVRAWGAVTPGGAVRGLGAVALLPAAALATTEAGQALRGWSVPVDPPGAAFTARVGLESAIRARTTAAALAQFDAAAQSDRMAAHDGALLDATGDHDILLTYIESYGRSSFENPLYVDTHVGRLRAIEAALAAEGLAMRSGWLTAPMLGGQSWLAHASIASGTWVSDQGRYRALISSPRRTLFHFAQEAGFHTAAVMPAHTIPWPEGDYFGFDTILNAADMGYEGENYNWVTMPDQFSLKVLDRLVRDPADDPVFAQTALVSSHAPFLPVPPLIDWDEIGDGTVFNEWADDGDPPEEVWRDRDRVREKFRIAVDYSLKVVGSYAERHADDPPLMIVLGDHEPARFIAGVDGYDVPVHIIGPPELVDRTAPWGYSEGMVPDPDAPVWRMSQFRDAFLRAFSHAAPE